MNNRTYYWHFLKSWNWKSFAGMLVPQKIHIFFICLKSPTFQAFFSFSLCSYIFSFIWLSATDAFESAWHGSCMNISPTMTNCKVFLWFSSPMWWDPSIYLTLFYPGIQYIVPNRRICGSKLCGCYLNIIIEKLKFQIFCTDILQDFESESVCASVTTAWPWLRVRAPPPRSFQFPLNQQVTTGKESGWVKILVQQNASVSNSNRESIYMVDLFWTSCCSIPYKFLDLFCLQLQHVSGINTYPLDSVSTGGPIL